MSANRCSPDRVTLAPRQPSHSRRHHLAAATSPPHRLVSPGALSALRQRRIPGAVHCPRQATGQPSGRCRCRVWRRHGQRNRTAVGSSLHNWPRSRRAHLCGAQSLRAATGSASSRCSCTKGNGARLSGSSDNPASTCRPRPSASPRGTEAVHSIGMIRRQLTSRSRLGAQIAPEMRHRERDLTSLTGVDQPLLDQRIPCGR